MSEHTVNGQIVAPPVPPLRGFRIAGFRTFQHLQIKDLGRVNLFVGKNNVGKTSLLEALKLYAAGATRTVIGDLLVSREEVSPAAARRRKIDADSLGSAINRLFHVGEDNTVETSLTLGPIDDAARDLTVLRGWADIRRLDEATSRMDFSLFRVEDLFGEQERALQVRFGGAQRRILLDSNLFDFFRTPAPIKPIFASSYVPAFGLGTDEIGAIWDKIALTDAEELVEDALRIIAPKLERISLLGDVERIGERRMVARMSGRSSPIPLRSMGDGMNRLLSISISLVSTPGGWLLLDEVENGVHYSVQMDMWSMIFDVAERLNVQVFATTHSWDCIQAFQATANARAAVGALWRLDQRHGDVVAVPFDERELAIAAREQIEIR